MDLKIKDVAELLNVSETTIRRWLQDGKIPAYRLNHQFRFSRIEIEDWVMSCKMGKGKKKISYDKVSSDHKKNDETVTKMGTHRFSLYRAIHKGMVLENLDGKTKEEVICQSMNIIAQKLNLDAEVVTELLLDREKLMSTALNQGIAVPHTRDFLLEDPFDIVSVVYLKKGIDYGALDGELVHTLFFLFAHDDKRHLHLIAKLAHFVNNEEHLNYIRSCPEKDQLLEYIKEWEANLGQQEYSKID